MTVTVSSALPIETSTLGVLGFTSQQEALYRLLLRNPHSSLHALSGLAGIPVEDLREQVAGLSGSGVVELRGDTVAARPPHEALARLIGEETRRLQSRGDQLDTVRRLLPAFTAEHLASSTPKGVEVTMEIVEAGDVLPLVRSLTVASSGDLLWLRPDPWNIALGPALDEWVKGVLRSGRRSRAIYPASVLEEAPEVIRERAGAGEHVRILAEVPCRLAIMGSTAVVIDEDFFKPNERRLVVRQHSMIEALTVMFESLWEKAVAVPGLDSRHDEGAGDRRLLLGQLAVGAKDEQIARALGISVRTVRRRVAEVLDDLGAQSRFQAGVEAVRRGWI